MQPAVAAVLGAFLSLALGVVPVELAVLALKLLFYPLVTMVSLMIITLVAERAGLFDVLAEFIAKAARGDGRRLFTYIFACGTLTGMLFTNDAAVLIFTPLVFDLVERAQGETWTIENKIPYYFAVLYVANLVGALVTSNPINIVVASMFHISFLDYAAWMFLPALASIVVSFAGLRLVFRGSVPDSFTWKAGPDRVHARRPLVVCSLVLGVTLVGLFTESLTGFPTWLVALAGAIVLAGIHMTTERGTLASIARGVSWDVLVFVVGIFVVVLGLRRAGLTQQLGSVLAALADLGPTVLAFGTSLLAAVSSSVLNNHPTADMMGWAIRDLAAPVQQTKMMAFAALIGGDLGPKMLPIGSLAALIWFRLLRERGVQISYALYVKIGIPITLAAIVAAVLVLNAERALVPLLPGF